MWTDLASKMRPRGNAANEWGTPAGALRVLLFLGLSMHPALGADPKLARFNSSGGCGFEDRFGSVAIEPRYVNCGEFSEGLAAVQVGQAWGYIDWHGKLAIKPRFTAADAFSEGLAFVELSSGTKAVIDTKGSVLFEADYYEHGRFSEGLAPVRPVSHWICFEGEALKEYSGSRAPKECPADQAMTADWEWGYIDRTGRLVIPPSFLMAEEFHEGLARERDGFIDHSGVEVIHTSASGFSEGLAAVEEDDQWGYIDKHGAHVVPLVYEAAEAMSDERGLVKKDGKYGYVDRLGTLVVPAQYDGALSFSENLAAVELGAKWGYIDPSGKVVIPFQFDSVQRFEDGQALVAGNSEVFVVDQHGDRLKTSAPSLGRTFERLQAFEVRASPENPRREGPLDAIVPLMTIYKEQLRDLATRKLKEFAGQAFTAEALKASIEQELARAGIRRSGKEGEARPYGVVEDLEVSRPREQPELLVVVFHLSLAATADSSLSIYRQQGGDRELVFRADHDGYERMEMDAYHMAAPEFTQRDAKGSFLMLLASDSGRSGDGSYAVDVELFRFDSSHRYDRIFHQSFAGKEHQVALDPDGFRLETMYFSYDTDRGCCRVFPYRYRVTDSSVERIAPIGLDAHDFVEAWGNLPWQEAAKWSDAAHGDRLRSAHERYRSDDGFFGGEFPSTQLCGREKWQVEFDPVSENGDDADAFFFIVERRDKWAFVMTDVRTEPLVGCKEDTGNGSILTMFEKPLEW